MEAGMILFSYGRVMSGVDSQLPAGFTYRERLLRAGALMISMNSILYISAPTYTAPLDNYHNIR